MKISKLFHWLYALVMLLPIFALGVTCAYVIFNKNAYESYSDFEQTNNIEYTQVENYSDFKLGHWYNLNTDNATWSNTTNNFYVTFSDFEIIKDSSNLIDNTTRTIRLSYYGSNTLWRIFVYDTNNVNTGNYVININNEVLSINFQFVSMNNSNDYQYFKQLFYSYENTPQTNSLDNVFYYSIDKVENSPLFSWAYDSFLVAPFSYIVALFGMPTNHVVVELLSYWLAISIIWLVFDLVMYVPLLVHRWLDKGVLE